MHPTKRETMLSLRTQFAMILPALAALFLLATVATAQSLDWVEPSLPSLPAARGDAGMAYDAATESIVLFGGGNGTIIKPTIVYGDTWIWRKGWVQQSPATSPSARGGPGMAYDPITSTVVFFGGYDVGGASLGDTWTWDGVAWTQQFPLQSPPGRSFNSQEMAYDMATGTVVLFGGYNNEGGVFGDTWEWDGKAKTWTQHFPASSPPPRGGSLAYDATRGRIVVFGGDNGGGDCCRVYYGDTWTWDGTTWTQHFPPSAPSARTDVPMAYDSIIGKVVLFGGFSVPGQGLNDTWDWDGSTWRQRQTPHVPPARWSAAMAFDPINEGLVLFGGELTGDPFANDTWLFIPVSRR